MSLEVKFAELMGKTIVGVMGKPGDDEFVIETKDGQTYVMHHINDCCESVHIEDIVGDINDLLGTPILEAEESTSSEGERPEHADDSFTWTFYKLRTIKGGVTIRWLGSSNGYYSESVDFIRRK